MHTPWSQQDSGITLSTGMGMIGVLEIMLIVPTLRVGMPLRTLRVRSRMWRRCVDKLQRYPRHALGSLNPQSVPFVTRSVTGGMPTRSDGHDQCRSGLVYNDERRAGTIIGQCSAIRPTAAFDTALRAIPAADQAACAADAPCTHPAPAHRAWPCPVPESR